MTEPEKRKFIADYFRYCLKQIQEQIDLSFTETEAWQPNSFDAARKQFSKLLSGLPAKQIDSFAEQVAETTTQSIRRIGVETATGLPLRQSRRCHTELNFCEVQKQAITFAATQGIALPDEPSFLMELSTAQIAAAQYIESIRKGEPASIPPAYTPPLCDPSPYVQELPLNKPLQLSACIEKYVRIKCNDGSWSAQTRLEWPKILNQFSEIIGNPPLSAMSSDHMRTYATALRRLPDGRIMKRKEYSGLTLSQILKTDFPENMCLSPKSVENRLIIIKSFINFLESEQLISSAKPFSKALTLPKVERQKVQEKSREPFTNEELESIFSPQTFTKEAVKEHNYWIWLLLFATGARREEVAQAEISDVKQTATGIWYLDVNDDGLKTVKTRAGRRQIPLHPLLLDLGFLEYVHQVKESSSSGLLFPTLSRSSFTGKLGQPISTAFTRYRRSLGIGAGAGENSKKVLHSLRHTYASYCKLHDINRIMVQQAIGHEPSDDITAIYETTYPLEAIYEGVTLKFNLANNILKKLIK